MRGPKKSETLEIRLPHAAKRAFMARCRVQGRSASEVLRAFIDGEIASPVRKRPLRWIPVALAALALGAVAAPSLARPSVQARFAQLDLDHDGRLSFAEFERGAELQLVIGGIARPFSASPDRTSVLRRAFDRMDLNGDGEIALDEFRRSYGQ